MRKPSTTPANPAALASPPPTTPSAESLTADFPVADWNIYCFQFSDGDNWGEDNQQALDLLSNSIIPDCNLFCYGQVESPYGSGDFIKELRKIEPNFDNLILSEIENREAVYQSIKTFLGKGK